MRIFAVSFHSQKSISKISFPKLNTIIKLPEKFTGFKKVLDGLFVFLTRQIEVKVWRSLDRSGNISWHVYDPYAERTYNFASEDAVRIWLDCYR